MDVIIWYMKTYETRRMSELFSVEISYVFQNLPS